MKESRWRYVLTRWCTSNLIVSLIDLGEYGARLTAPVREVLKLVFAH